MGFSCLYFFFFFLGGGLLAISKPPFVFFASTEKMHDISTCHIEVDKYFTPCLRLILVHDQEQWLTGDCGTGSLFVLGAVAFSHVVHMKHK